MTFTLPKNRLFATAIVALAIPVSAMAQSGQGDRPEKPDFGAMAQALNVSESSMENCLPKPAKGERPEKPDASSVASCLQADNASLTSAQVDDVLKQYGPRPPKK